MKAIRIFTIAAAALGLLASCQKENAGDFGGDKKLVPVTLTAFINADNTKVTYTENTTGSTKLQPKWEVGDKVYAFDGTKIAYTFDVAAVDATTGKATLTGDAPASCTLHLIYVNGSDVAPSVSGGKISVSYKGQKGDDTMPAVMLADGEVRYGIGDFHFANAGAVIGIKAVKGVANGSTISRIRISGANLSAATISINGSGKLALSATGMSTDAISTVALSGVTVTDANGTLSAPVFIAVPAGATIDDVNAKVGTKTYTYSLAEPHVPLTASQYAYVNGQQFSDPLPYVEIAGVKWARQNLAVSASGNKKWKGNGSSAVKVPETGEDVIIGDFIQWGSSRSYPPADDEDPGVVIYYSFNYPKCVGDSHFSISQYKPIKDDPGNYAFTQIRGPFFTNGTPNVYCDDDNLFKLETQHDAATSALGGDWRMPTSDEWQSLYDNTTWTWSDSDCGVYVTDKGEALEDDKSNALLFFPAAGFLKDNMDLNGGQVYVDDEGGLNYWSSERPDNWWGAYKMHFGWNDDSSSYKFESRHGEPRWQGLNIRPVSD